MLAPQLPAMTQLTQLTRLQQPWDHRIWLTCSVKQSRCSKSLAVKARLNACPTSGASGASSDTWWDLYRYLAGSEKSGRAQMMIWLGQLVCVYIYIYNCIYIYDMMCNYMVYSMCFYVLCWKRVCFGCLGSVNGKRTAPIVSFPCTALTGFRGAGGRSWKL